MVDKKSDFTKPRTKLHELLPSYVRTQVIDNVFENTFNRFLTKEDTLTRLGFIGNIDATDGLQQIPETTVHRQAFQLQPLAYAMVGDENLAFSQKDVFRKLVELGVDISALDVWGQTEQFNFIPPIDPDKLINYSDYYWYNPDNLQSVPDYITVKNRCNVATSRYLQKVREAEEFGNQTVEQVTTEGGNTVLVVRNNISDQVSGTGSIDLSGTASSDGTYQVISATYDAGYTYITVDQLISFSTSNYGSISIESSVDAFLAERNIVCSGSVGWDTTPWDDSDNGNNWDGAEYEAYPENDWNSNNFWFHRLDLTPKQIGASTRAIMPIIEYLDTIQMNEWATRTHTWKKYDLNLDEWVTTDASPTRDDIYTDNTYQTIDPSFWDNWLYVASSVYSPSQSYVEDPSSVKLTTYSADPTLQLVRSPNNLLFTFPVEHQDEVLADSSVMRVYVDGVRQVGTFFEVTASTNVHGTSADTVQAIQFLSPIPSDSQVEAYVSATLDGEVGLEAVPVRTTENTLTLEVKELITTTKVEQQKTGTGQYPLFNVFDIFGNFLFASPIFYFKTDSTRTVNAQIGQRIALDDLNRPIFEHDLVSVDNGKLRTYFDLETNGLQTVWRTSYPDSVIYQPSKVNAQALEPEAGEPSDWEIVDPFLLNPSHELWKEITYTQLVAHFQSMSIAQENPEGLVNAPTYAARLAYRPDYGLGGTIKEHNYAYDMLVSSVVNQISDPVKIYEFAAQQYNELQNFILEYITSNYVDFFTTQTGSLASKTASLIDGTIETIEENASLARRYGDSGSFDETTLAGIKNWIATLPMLRLVERVLPLELVDEKLNVYDIRHHDGHLLTPRMAQATENDLTSAINSTQLTSGRLRGWSTTQSADGGTFFTSKELIPLSRLAAQDTWLDSNALYTFDVIAISTSQPSLINAMEGDLWANTTDGNLYQLVSSGGQLQWVFLSSDTSLAWKQLDINQILRSTILEVENRLYDVSSASNQLRLESSDVIETQQQQDLYDATMEKRFLIFCKNRSIQDPYAMDYDPSNPFTWNYSQVPVTSPFVYFPYTKDVERWGSRYQTIYRNVFGTEYPHLEPWVLQGFRDKPSWWDSEYAGTTRPWSTTMWDNIKQGILPVGITSPTPVPTYNFVCVNTTDEATSDGYEPDDLLPPYWIPGPSSPLSIADFAASTETFIRDENIILGSAVDSPIVFGDEGPIETIWRKSTNYQYDVLISLFTASPVKTFFYTWGYDVVNVGELLVDGLEEKVPSHVDVVFHGDIRNGAPYISNGVNQWFVNYNRFRDHDNVKSGFSPIWIDWESRMSYQTDTFVDIRTASLSTKNYSLTGEDYDIFVKKSNAIQTLDIPSLRFKTVGYGDFVFRNQRKVPKADGSNWKFTLDVPGNWITSITYYPVKDASVSSIDLNSSTVTFGVQHWWETGDPITVSSFGDVPAPLSELETYYVIKISSTEIRIAASKTDASQGNAILLTNNGGNREIRVQTVESGFVAKGGANTAVEWKHCEIVPTELTVNLPLEIESVQSVINVIDGFRAYQEKYRGIVSNPDQDIIDPDTGRVFGWQTEIERSIDYLYSGIGLDNRLSAANGSSYAATADPVTNLINAPNMGSVATGTEVYFYSPAILPSGLLPVTQYYAIAVSRDVFRVATSKVNAEAGIFVNIMTNGAGSFFVSTYPDAINNVDEWIEVNPYRNSMWVPTVNGVLSNIVRGPYSDIQTEITIQDQDGNPLRESDVFVLRYDKGTKITVPIYGQASIYDAKRFSVGRFYIDGFEHVIMLENYTTDGNLLYDDFLGLQVRGFDLVSFLRQRESVKRPSVGGFFLNGDQLTPNFEKLTIDMSEMYDQFTDDEYGDFAKALLGFEDLEFFDKLDARDQTKFTFWKGMIQSKGSRKAIDAFINSRQFVDARVDEYWAYRVATFGDVGKKAIAEFEIQPQDLNGSDLWVVSGTANGVLTDFNSAGPDDPTVPPTEACIYDFDAFDLSDYNVLDGDEQFELGIPVTDVLYRQPSSPDADIFEIDLVEGTQTSHRAASNLLEQYRIGTISRGDYLTDRENRYGFQINISEFIPTVNIGDAATRILESTVYMVGVTSGVGNILKLVFRMYSGNGVDPAQVTLDCFVRTYGGSPAVSTWEHFAILDLTSDVNMDEAVEWGIYYDKTLRKIGIAINGVNKGLIQPNDVTYPDNEYLYGTVFDHLGLVLEAHTSIEVGDPIAGRIVEQEIITDPGLFTAGFPIEEQIYSVCQYIAPLSGCVYPLISSESQYEPDFLAKLPTIYPELNVAATNTFSSMTLPDPSKEMEVQYTVQSVGASEYNYALATSETYVTRVMNANSKFAIRGDTNLTQANDFYAFAVDFNNVLSSDLTQGYLFAGFELRGTSSVLSDGIETVIRFKIGQIEDNTINTNKLVIEYGTVTLSGTSNIQTLEEVITLTDLVSSRIEVRIDAQTNRVAWLANNGLETFLKESNGTTDFVFPSDESFRKMSLTTFVESSNISAADSNIGNSVNLIVDTSTNRYAYPVEPICTTVDGPANVVDPNDSPYTFGWGTTAAAAGDSVVPLIGFGNDETLVTTVYTE